MSKEFLNKIINRNLRISVVGSGYVGLPTATLFADFGFDVTAIDIKSIIIKNINEGNSPINENGLQEILSRSVRNGKLKAVLNCKAKIYTENVVIVTVQTPVDENNKPDLSFLINALEFIGKNLLKGMLVVICSTIPPGTMQNTIRPLLESLSGLNADIDFYLSYVPERIAPGNALKEFVESPRLVGGIGPNSTNVSAALFRTVCKKMVETDSTTAEIAKTAENTYRDVNIAFANQLALICEEKCADIKKIIELANTHPRVNIHNAGPGVGGPCLTKDPYLLTYNVELEYNVVNSARNLNDYMPKHVVKLITNSLNIHKKNIAQSKIAILGTAYKANVDDPRSSPAEPIVRSLKRLGAEVTSYDPYCSETFGAKKSNSINESVENADCMVVVTDHSEFKHLQLEKIQTLMKSKPIIVDGKRIIVPEKAQKFGFEYYGIGYGKASKI